MMVRESKFMDIRIDMKYFCFHAFMKIFKNFIIILAEHATTKCMSLRGVGRFEETDHGGLKEVSFAGGADAFIWGSGFSDRPSDNTVSLTTDKFGESRTFFCPKLSSKFKISAQIDAYSNNPLFYALHSSGRVPLQGSRRTPLLQDTQR